MSTAHGLCPYKVHSSTRWHGADLGYVPVVIADACGAGNEEEAARSLDLLRFAGDAILTDTATITPLLRRASSGSVSG